MNDREHGRRTEGGPDDLRAILRQWRVPETPPGIEDELRRAFRHRRNRGRDRAWKLALAAGLVIAVVTTGRATFAPRPPVAAPPPTPERSLSAVAGRDVLETTTPPVEPVGGRSKPWGERRSLPAAHRTARRVEPVVIVEPGQAALLAQLARDLRGVRHALPGGPPAAAEVMSADARPEALRHAPARDEPRSYHRDWKQIDAEWPSVHWSF